MWGPLGAAAPQQYGGQSFECVGLGASLCFLKLVAEAVGTGSRSDRAHGPAADRRRRRRRSCRWMPAAFAPIWAVTCCLPALPVCAAVRSR